MRQHELDHILSREKEIVPSAKFTASVMGAIRSEAAAPPPISFPWVRALPGLITGAGALVWIIVQSPAGPGVSRATTAAFFQSWLDRLAAIVQSAESTGIGWVLLSLLLTFACWELTLRAVGKRS
ncbi:MAG TPA: hypothetical protein VMT78_00735 [Terriglobia bacterium]|nr:hypothetical protein [Terriglobia bacterium]